MGSEGRPLVGLHLADWSKSDLISSSEGLTGIACLAEPELQTSEWGCQSPLLRASPAAQQPMCQPSLSLSKSAEVTDEVGS